jgi:hypothetical protein
MNDALRRVALYSLVAILSVELLGGCASSSDTPGKNSEVQIDAYQSISAARRF